MASKKKALQGPPTASRVERDDVLMVHQDKKKSFTGIHESVCVGMVHEGVAPMYTLSYRNLFMQTSLQEMIVFVKNWIGGF
jgi:hypothetical protein